MLINKIGSSVWLYPAIAALLMYPQHPPPLGHFSQCTPSEVEAREQDPTGNAPAAVLKARASHVSAMPRALLSIAKVLSSASALNVGAGDDPCVDFLAKVRVWY